MNLQVALYKGKDQPYTLKVCSKGKYRSKIKSSGKTTGYQTFDPDTVETSQIELYLDIYISNNDVRLAFTGVCGFGEMGYVTVGVVAVVCNQRLYLKPGVILLMPGSTLPQARQAQYYTCTPHNTPSPDPLDQCRNTVLATYA